MKLISAITTYREAVEQLQIATDAIDQAHSMLKDLKLDNCIQTGYGSRRTIRAVSFDVESLLEDLKRLACDDCGQPLAENIACLEGRCPAVEGR
jgi:hypothetical protein